MHTGKLVFAQLMEHAPLHTFRRCVAKYPGKYPTLSFSHRDQFLCMVFAQLTFRVAPSATKVTTVRFPPDCVAGFNRNGCPPSLRTAWPDSPESAPIPSLSEA